MYSYLKRSRSAPHAALIVVDGPTSDTVCAHRERSNTPLQGLTLLNDPVYMGAAEALARRGLAREGLSAAQSRHIHHPLPPGCEADAKTTNVSAELAAWTSVARVLLNLDETITKE